MRVRGRRLPWSEIKNQAGLVGMISTWTCYYKGAGHVPAASLRDPDRQTEDGCLLTLYEPQLVSMGLGAMNLKGIERFETDDGPAGYVQEWAVEFLSPHPCRQAAEATP